MNVQGETGQGIQASTEGIQVKQDTKEDQEKVDYSECELESGSESVASESTIEGDEDNNRDWSLEELWTPGTLNSRLMEVGQQYTMLTAQNRKTENTVQRSEMSSMDKMLEMFLQMKQDDPRMRQEDKIREERREQEQSEEKDREREQKREERQIQLLTQLKEAQPTIPQQVTINQHKLPMMTKDDDVEIFVRQLEVALRTARVPQDKWKQSLLSQLTLEAKERVIHLLEDDDSQ